MLMKRRFEPLRSVTDPPNPLPHSGDREENRETLKLIVQIIKGSVRKFDVVGRIGGEEFSVLLPGVGPGTVGKVARIPRYSKLSGRD